MTEIDSIVEQYFPGAPFQFLAMSVIDFSNSKFYSRQWYQRDEKIYLLDDRYYFDLASVSKPLINGVIFLEKEEIFCENKQALLNHRGSLPAWGLLDQKTWKDQLFSYPIHPSETLYSDFSSLRLMLELQKELGEEAYLSLIKKNAGNNLVYWLDLDREKLIAPSGWRKNQLILGDVHDPNAYQLKCFCSHAGFFAHIDGLSQFLLDLNSKHHVLSRISKLKGDRFKGGWDSISSPETTLAGKGCDKNTFGHLGFTGTSVWLDPSKKLGYCLLSNGTQNYWYERSHLNHLRRKLGEWTWQNFSPF